LIEAELAESIAASNPALDADEILAALEAEVGRAAVARAGVAAPPAHESRAPARPLEFAVTEREPAPEPPPQTSARPTPPPVSRRPAPRAATPPAEAPTGTAVCGVAPDQVRAWMDAVQDDLRQVRARVQFLRAEQSRLEDQQRLVAELITSSNAF
jgi:hypothetical protein